MADKKEYVCIKECVFPKAEGGAVSFRVDEVVKSAKLIDMVSGSANFKINKEEKKKKEGK